MLQSRKAQIIARLRDRLDLEPGDYASRVWLDPRIGLITDVDALLAEYKEVEGLVSVTGTGGFYLNECPSGKRWTIYAYHVYQSTGTYTFTQLELYDASEALSMQYGATWIATNNRAQEFTQPLVMNEGDNLGILVDAQTVTGNCIMRLWLKEEDAF